ncbi:MAG: 13E12 repeat family protein [Actinomycetota bacterium]|nr:13E12 repeat family protein [Actinomycetota bacterium]
MYGKSDQQLIQSADGVHQCISSSQRELFRLIAEVDRREAWWDSGARDMAHWLYMRYGISDWKARRWIASAHALEELPLIGEAFATGVLGIDKVVELTRFATPDTERRLIPWATRVAPGCIRRRADVESRQVIEGAADAERDRRLSWWYFDEGRRFGMEAELPAAHGAVVARALERVAETIPVMPGEDGPFDVHARRADALVAVCSSRLSADPDPDRATVVVHASVGTLASGGGAEIEGGGVLHPHTLDRLLCSARVQAVMEDRSGDPVHLGRMRREPPAWMFRQLRYRDSECRFPGCGARRFTQAHHIVWWGTRRSHRPRQPGPDLLLPPQAGARARVDHPP